jgi:ribosome assembly protein YihI (activator of Der GTPase)
LEFTQLVTEKEKLQAQIKESCEAQSKALKASKKALEELQVARAREERLQQQIDLLDCRAKEAISVEEQSIVEQELDEGTITFNGLSKGITLLPST